MKYNAKNGKDIQVVDFWGKVIPLVKSFDTETCEAELYISAGGSKVAVVETEGHNGKGEVLVVKAVLCGCKAVPKSASKDG